MDRQRAMIDRAVVGIAGAGGLGSNVAMHLVRAGVRRLVIVDFDRVSESNLNRQFYFQDQVGQVKVEALQNNLAAIRSDLEVIVHAERLTAANAAGFFSACDIVVEALDSGEAKAMFIQALMAAGKRLVAASGIAGWGRSNAVRVRRVGGGLYLVGDCETGVDRAAPESPRVGIAAAMQANTVIAALIGEEI